MPSDWWRGLCALPVLPEAVPTRTVWTEAEVVELLRFDDDEADVANRFQSRGVGAEAAGDAATAYFKAARVGDPDWRATNGGRAVWRNEVEAVLAVLNAGAEKALNRHGAPVVRPEAAAQAAIDALNARVSALLLERDEARRVGAEALTRATAAEAEAAEWKRLYGEACRETDKADNELHAARDDRRFELVKAAMASGRDGFTAVRDADEAIMAMGKAEGGGS